MLAKAKMLLMGAVLTLFSVPVLCAAASDATVRVALPRLDRLAPPTRASTFNCALGLHLRSRLKEIPSVALVSDNRSAAIMGELVNPAHAPDLPDLLGAYRSFQSVDVCVYYAHTGSGVRIVVQTASRRFDETMAMPEDMPLADGVQRAARMIGEALELRPHDMAVLMESRWKDPEDFAAYYECQLWPVPSVTPTYRGPEYGDTRLERLRERWNKNKEDPYFAEQVFKNALELAVSTRHRDFFRVNWVLMAQQSLTAILGSPLESAAYPLIRVRPDDYRGILFDLCGPLSDAGVSPSIIIEKAVHNVF